MPNTLATPFKLIATGLPKTLRPRFSSVFPDVCPMPGCEQIFPQPYPGRPIPDALAQFLRNALHTKGAAAGNRLEECFHLPSLAYGVD